VATTRTRRPVVAEEKQRAQMCNLGTGSARRAACTRLAKRGAWDNPGTRVGESE
jgi:hypothetical protein